MFQWSDEHLMIQDAVRRFIDEEVRPHVDELETGQLPPFDITRKMLATFGIDAMNREQLEKDLAAEEAGEEKPKSGGGTLGSSMALILNMELAGVSLGLVGSMGVSMGLTVSTIRSRGTLAQKKRWLPELVTMEKVGKYPAYQSVAIHLLKEPSEKQIAFMKERAILYQEYRRTRLKSWDKKEKENPLTVDGFELVETKSKTISRTL